MYTIDQLLAMSKDYMDQDDVWPALTTANGLFQILQAAVRPETTGRVQELMDLWQSRINTEDGPTEDQWQIASTILTCAQIAALTGDTAAHLPDLLHQLDPDVVVPDGLVCQAKSLEAKPEQRLIEVEGWRWFVRHYFDQLTWPPLLSTAWGWDVVTTMGDCPRLWTHKENITVLLVGKDGGVTARLTLEWSDDEGHGILYPNPETMSFVTRDEAFVKAEQNAVAFARSVGLWEDEATFDVRWRLVRPSGEVFPRLEGGSAGAAFALGLAKLLAGK